MLGIRELRLFDTDPEATAKLKLNLRGRTPARAHGHRAAPIRAEAVRGADIVTTVTADKRNALILTPDMIEPGMHLNAVGGDCPGKTELHVGYSALAATRASWWNSSRRRASRARSSSSTLSESVIETRRRVVGQAAGAARTIAT